MQMLQDRHGSIDYGEEGAGPTIVFVPGSWATGSAWRGVIAALDGRFRTVTTSLPGYGGTRERRTTADNSMDPQGESVPTPSRPTRRPEQLSEHTFSSRGCRDGSPVP